MKHSEQHGKKFMDRLYVGDTFIDPMDGEERTISMKGQLIMGTNGKLPHWDNSVFCEDGGCVSAEEAFNGLTI